jgi:hypothetical protein
VGQFDWLNHRHLTAITRREHDWVFSFSDGISLVVACLWRLIEHERIKRASPDDGQQFGLPAPVDAERELNDLIGNSRLVSVELRDGTLDLRLIFENGRALEIIPDSSGYEAWTLQRADQQYIAVGGGTLAVWESNPKNRA